MNAKVLFRLCFLLVCGPDCEDGLKSVHLYEGSGQRSASASPGHKRDLSSSSTRPARYLPHLES